MAMTDPVSVSDAVPTVRTFNRLSAVPGISVYTGTHLTVPEAGLLEYSANERLDKKRSVMRQYWTIRVTYYEYPPGATVPCQYGAVMACNWDQIPHITRAKRDNPVKIVATLATTAGVVDKLDRKET